MIDVRTAARERAIAWAREVVADPSTVFLDTETTGIGTDAEIVDVAVVGLDGTILLDQLVRPEEPIPAGASAVHGIYDHMVSASPSWRQLLGEVNLALASRRVVVYNVGFDRPIIEARTTQHGATVPARDWQCAMLAWADFRGEPGRYGSYRWHKLEEVMASLGLPPGGHRALGDALACREVVLHMACASA